VVLLQVVDVEILEQFEVDESAVTVLDIGAFVLLCQRFPQIGSRDLVFLDQDAFEVAEAFPRFGRCGVKIILSETVAAQ
jgi:hypothetical protein